MDFLSYAKSARLLEPLLRDSLTLNLALLALGLDSLGECSARGNCIIKNLVVPYAR